MRYRIILVSCVALALIGIACTAAQLQQAQAGHDVAAQTLAAATQTTAAAQATLATMPAGTAGAAAARADLLKLQKIEVTAQQLVDMYQQGIDAAKSQRIDSPESIKVAQTAISMIPSPYTPIIAALAPLLLAGVGFGIQSFKHGQTSGALMTTEDAHTTLQDDHSAQAEQLKALTAELAVAQASLAANLAAAGAKVPMPGLTAFPPVPGTNG